MSHWHAAKKNHRGPDPALVSMSAGSLRPESALLSGTLRGQESKVEAIYPQNHAMTLPNTEAPDTLHGGAAKEPFRDMAPHWSLGRPRYVTGGVTKDLCFGGSFSSIP